LSSNGFPHQTLFVGPDGFIFWRKAFLLRIEIPFLIFEIPKQDVIKANKINHKAVCKYL
jgi:hypothetical protein